MDWFLYDWGLLREIVKNNTLDSMKGTLVLSPTVEIMFCNSALF